jgi:hypothetical protein
MRKTVHLPLQFLRQQTPVLGAARRQEVAERLEARYTMHAERSVHNNPESGGSGAVEGVELF